MKRIQAGWDFRSFVVGISNYTQDSNYWSWTAYLGFFAVAINILKPRRMRRARCY